MSESGLRYLSVADVIAIHEVAMRESDQPATALVREDALRSAVHHPRNLGWYAQAGLAEQVVEFMIYVAMALAFVDGNKRTAVRSAEVFLELNGFSIPGYDEYIRFADLLITWIASPNAARPAAGDALVSLVNSWMV